MKTQLNKSNQENLFETNFHRSGKLFVHSWLGRFVVVFSVLVGNSGNFLFAQSASQHYTFSGMVSDSTSGKGIPYVTIGVSNSEKFSKIVPSDENGKFSITLNSAGKYDLTFHSIGFRETKKEIVIKEGNPPINLGTVSLAPSDERLGEVTVSVLKPLVRSEAEKLVYSVETDPESTSGNALDMLRKVPMVSVDGDNRVQMRGMSGVKFLINGKSSAALDQNTADVLKNMPSNTIKDIEVLTNPSSKYDAEGNAGVINIITTRKVSDGYNGNMSAAINTFGQYNGNINFASKINKIIYSLNGVMNHWQSPGSITESSTEKYISTTNRYSESKGAVNDSRGDWYSFNGEASYEIDTLNLISVAFNGDFSNNESLWLSTVEDFDLSHVKTSANDKRGKFMGDWNNFTGTFDYQKLFKRKDRILTLSYRNDHSLNGENHNDKFLGLLNFPDYWQKIIIDGANNEQTLQVDYVDPFSKKSQIEAGFKQIWRKNNTSNDRSIFDNSLNDWVHSDFGSNNLDYTQRVFGIYFTYQLKWNKGGFKAGLRAENTVNRGFFKSINDTTFTNKMFNLVPFLLLSKDFEKGKSLKLSYTKRLARPYIWLLNPYYDDTDPRNIIIGNPKLKTEVTNNFDFSFNKFSEKFNFSLNLNAVFSNNLINDVSFVRPNGVKITTHENIGKDEMAGGTIYGSVKVTKNLNVDATLGLNYRTIESNNDAGLKNSGWSNSENFNVRLTPWKNGTLLASAMIGARSIALEERSGRWNWSNLAYQHDFLNKKLKFEARVNTPFSKYHHYKSEQFSPDFYSWNSYRYPSRSLNIKLSYNFGQMKDQVKKSQKSIRNDDLKQ